MQNGFLKKILKKFSFKMEVGFSKDLSLFQLNDHPTPKSMFNKIILFLHRALNIC